LSERAEIKKGTEVNGAGPANEGNCGGWMDGGRDKLYGVGEAAKYLLIQTDSELEFSNRLCT